MGNHNRVPWLRGAVLLCMATTASALSLSNFQLITSTQVPLGCILAYNQPLSFCGPRDFTRGSGCSEDCVDSIRKLQSTLQAVCGDGPESASSLLGQAMLGTLVDVLCPAAGLTTSSSTTVKKFTLTTVVPPRTTSTERPTTPATTSSSSSSTATPLASDIPNSTPQQPPPTSPSQTGNTRTATQQQQQPTTSAAEPNSNPVGSGSLFDEPLISLSHRLYPNWLTTPLFGLALGIVLFR